MLMMITVKPDDKLRTQNGYFFLLSVLASKVSVLRLNERENLYTIYTYTYVYLCLVIGVCVATFYIIYVSEMI